MVDLKSENILPNLLFMISQLQVPEYQYPMETMIKVLQQYQGLQRSGSSAFSPLPTLILNPEETKTSNSAFSKVRNEKIFIVVISRQWTK